ncbi:MAG: tRNA (adenosine(37)-N6)-threonylcarbamoyltransferase complex dimerization subunit type 1 TsaB [Williamsia sp.]|nr:tRNA (adenosine(37)-N6)-threonylcarbamoyltransferase complex dimerization subunit type 1 TsaB [Williamsia sp.]
MALLLNIDTSTEGASICLADGATCLGLLSNHTQKDHAAWLHPAIQQALHSANKKITDLTAVGITAGPGSYTGLRVAMASAKGLCYALHIPLIAVNTLEAMVYAARSEEADYLCPAIDARRMEIFTAVYDKNFNTILGPQSLIIQPDSFSTLLETKSILFFGNGSRKMQPVIQHPHAFFKDIPFNATHLAAATFKKYEHQEFASLALAEPIYLKEFV